MRTTLFLGPGSYQGGEDGEALPDRRRLATLLAPERRVMIMEDEPGRIDEALAEKFLRLAASADDIVVWLPRGGVLPTVFGELVAIRFRPELHGKLVVLFHDGALSEIPGTELLVNEPTGRIGYLKDLADVVRLQAWRYATPAMLHLLLRDFATDRLGPKAQGP